MGCTYMLLCVLLLGYLLKCNASVIKDTTNNYEYSLPSSSHDEERSKRGLNSLMDPVPSSGNQRLLVLTVAYPNLVCSFYFLV